MENEVEYMYELSILDEKLIEYLDLDTDEVSEIPLTMKYEEEETFETYVPYGDTSVRLCGNSVDIQIYSILTPYKGDLVEVVDVMSKKDIEWLGVQIAEGSIS